MTNVAQVIQDKAEQAIYTVSPDATVLEAISIMAEKGIGALVVTQDNEVVGILSERDYTRKVALMERSSYDTTVSEIMTAKVLTISRSNTVEECLQLMTDRHLRHLPVVEEKKLVGLISIGDLVKAAMQDQKNLIDQLQQYISG
ncbi:CBS domain-containing protein [Acinetobacter ursingii]|uniref:CBS domain-containing protein n=1 Tax=Acinetobacter ursingii TaxID=108980 RepID=A0AA46NTA6_9GAMM|nr:CBS domain-containing protein [Acinetobacter ursingii]MEC8056081.1 CBS domain-containing protein [Pseudomonadota bacterium]MCU4304841.1 CBS domain-containing protein [Acinetobacter ursingii]MCU4357701.1 CBS domain-containing protein [Acinetobacter ursingii]MCU4370846.1 CBS domain-containing protein [Acinetobacter ursingii]MCU4488370.1 CBS domain-containing protein [Acinetobacter ursingii]